MCPGNHESAGKRLSGRTRKGSPWLGKLLVEAAHAAAHTKNTYLSALYHRLKARLGAKKAMMAVGHAFWSSPIRRLEKLGYEVSLQPAPQVA